MNSQTESVNRGQVRRPKKAESVDNYTQQAAIGTVGADYWLYRTAAATHRELDKRLLSNDMEINARGLIID